MNLHMLLMSRRGPAGGSSPGSGDYLVFGAGNYLVFGAGNALKFGG